MPPSDFAPLNTTPSYNSVDHRSSYSAADQSPATSSRGSFTGTSRTGASSPTSTPGTRGILEHQPKFFGSSSVRTASRDRTSRTDRTEARMLLEEDDLRNRLSGVGRPLDAREPHHAFYQTRRREDPRMSPAAGRSIGPRNASPHTPSHLIIRDVRTPAGIFVQPRSASTLSGPRSGPQPAKRSADAITDRSRPVKRSRHTRRDTPPIYIDSSGDEAGPSKTSALSRAGADRMKDDDDDIQYIPPEEAKKLPPARKSRSPSKLSAPSVVAALPQTTTERRTTTPSASPPKVLIVVPPASATVKTQGVDSTVKLDSSARNNDTPLGTTLSSAVKALSPEKQAPPKVAAEVPAPSTPSSSDRAANYRRFYNTFPYGMSSLYTGATAGAASRPAPPSKAMSSTAGPGAAPSLLARQVAPPTQSVSRSGAGLAQSMQPDSSASSPSIQQPATSPRQPPSPAPLRASHPAPPTSLPSARPSHGANSSSSAVQASTPDSRSLPAAPAYSARQPSIMAGRLSWTPRMPAARPASAAHSMATSKPPPDTTAQTPRNSSSTSTQTSAKPPTTSVQPTRDPSSAASQISRNPPSTGGRATGGGHLSSSGPYPRPSTSPSQASRPSSYADTLAVLASNFGLDADFLSFPRERNFSDFMPSPEAFSILPTSPTSLAAMFRPLPGDNARPERPAGLSASTMLDRAAYGPTPLSLPQRRPLASAPPKTLSTSSTPVNLLNGRSAVPGRSPTMRNSLPASPQETAPTRSLMGQNNLPMTAPVAVSTPSPVTHSCAAKGTTPQAGAQSRTPINLLAVPHSRTNGQSYIPSTRIQSHAARTGPAASPHSGAATVRIAPVASDVAHIPPGPTQAQDKDTRPQPAAIALDSAPKNSGPSAKVLAIQRPITPQQTVPIPTAAASSQSAQRIPRIVLKVSVPPGKSSGGAASHSQAPQSTTPPGSPSRVVPRATSTDGFAGSRRLHDAKPASRRSMVSQDLADLPRAATVHSIHKTILPKPQYAYPGLGKGSQSAPTSPVIKLSSVSTTVLRRSSRSREASPNPDLQRPLGNSSDASRQDTRSITSLTLKFTRSPSASVPSAANSAPAEVSTASDWRGSSVVSSKSGPVSGTLTSSSDTSLRDIPLGANVSASKLYRIAPAPKTMSREVISPRLAQKDEAATFSDTISDTAAVDAGITASAGISPVAQASTPQQTSAAHGVDRAVKDAHRPNISSPLTQPFATPALATRPSLGASVSPTPKTASSREEWLFPAGVRLPPMNGFIPEATDIARVLSKIAARTARSAHWHAKAARKPEAHSTADGRGALQLSLLSPDAHLKELRERSASKLPPLFRPKGHKRPMPFLHRNIRQGLHGIAALQARPSEGSRRLEDFRRDVIAHMRGDDARHHISLASRLDGLLARREVEESLASHCRIHRGLSVHLKSVRFIGGSEDIPFDERTIFAIHSRSEPAESLTVEAVRSATLTIRVDGRLVWRDARSLAMGQRKFCKFVGRAADEPIEIMLPPNSRSITYELSDMRDRFGDFWPPLEGGPRTWVGRVALGRPRGGRDMLWGEDDLPERVDLRVPPRESSGLPTSDYGHYGVRLSARYEPLSLEPALRMRAIRPSIIRTMGSEIEVTYITASTPEEVVQARAGVSGATGAASILTRCVTLRGWKCVACRRLGDLGGEEELAIHLRVYHAGECAVECFGRTAFGDIIKLGLLVMLGSAMPKPAIPDAARVVTQSPGDRWRASMIEASIVTPATAGDDGETMLMGPVTENDVGDPSALEAAAAAAGTKTTGNSAHRLDVSLSSADDDERMLDEDTSDASGEVPLVADLSGDALSPPVPVEPVTRNTVLVTIGHTDGVMESANDKNEVARAKRSDRSGASVDDTDATDPKKVTNPPRADPPVFALPTTPLTAGIVKAFNGETTMRILRERPAAKVAGGKESAVILTPPSMVRDLSSELSSIAQSVEKRRPGRLRPWEEDSTVLPGEEVPNYENPLGLMQPQMKGRQNEFTTWSSRINPGTAFDLIPELDKLWDGGQFRYLLRHIEECNISLWHHLSEKRRFMCMCWGRWRDEKGPLTAKKEAMVPYLRQWLDKYAPIMRRAELHDEVIDFFYFLFAEDLITGRAMRKAEQHWLRLAKQERKRLGQETEQDLWDAQMAKQGGVAAWDERSDSEPEGPLPDGDQWAIDVIEKYARKYKVNARRMRKAEKEMMRDEVSDGSEARSTRVTRVTRTKRKRTRTRTSEISEDTLGPDDYEMEDEDEADEEEEGRPRTRRRLRLRERRESRKSREMMIEEDGEDLATVMTMKNAVDETTTMTTTTTSTTTNMTRTTDSNGAE